MVRRRSSRPIRTASLAVAAAVALSGCTAAAPAAETGPVIWADYGGPTNTARQSAYFDSFTAQTGTAVTSTTIADALLYELLEGGEAQYDLVQVYPDLFYRYSEHLAVLPDSVPRSDAVPEEIRDYAVGVFTVANTQGWLADTFPDGGPEDWADFFDTEAFPGKRAWPGSPSGFANSFEIALLADGVAPEDLYPLDLDRATAKLDELRDDLIFYTSYPEIQSLLSTGSVSIAAGPTGQFTALESGGLAVEIQWHHAFLSPNFFVIPEAAPHPESAVLLAEWLADPQRQAEFTLATGYGPADSAVYDLLEADIAAALPGAPSHTAELYLDEVWRGENYDLLLDTYTEWLVG